MFSNIFWVAMAIPTAILIGGLIIWAISKPAIKPNLATRWDETEAQILEEYGAGMPNSRKHRLVEDDQRKARPLKEITGEKEGD